MKAILVLIMSSLIFVSAGWPETDEQATNVVIPEVYEQAGSLEEISGTWYSISSGMMLRFHRDGSAEFGVDTTGKAIGFEADIWYEGQELFITFTDYDPEDVSLNESEICVTAVGIYELLLDEDGNIQFTLVQDNCQFRAELLAGKPGLDQNFLFQSIPSK